VETGVERRRPLHADGGGMPLQRVQDSRAHRRQRAQLTGAKQEIPT
jgi:hypothetical protein